MGGDRLALVTGAGSVDTTMSTEPAGAPIVAALELAWSAIRAHHSDVPPVVIVTGSGGTGARVKLGHYAATTWHDRDGRTFAEVLVSGEGLQRGAADVLGTLLHEAAHAVAHVRDVKDTSRQGRWHNARFKALAEELGAQVTKDPRIGWSPTTVPEITRQRYAGPVTNLDAVLRVYRSGPGAAQKGKGQPASECGCGRRIRVSAKVLDAGPIVCGLCGSAFTVEN